MNLIGISFLASLKTAVVEWNCGKRRGVQKGPPQLLLEDWKNPASATLLGHVGVNVGCAFR
jgi:hypothetical protein